MGNKDTAEVLPSAYVCAWQVDEGITDCLEWMSDIITVIWKYVAEVPSAYLSMLVRLMTIITAWLEWMTDMIQ